MQKESAEKEAVRLTAAKEESAHLSLSPSKGFSLSQGRCEGTTVLGVLSKQLNHNYTTYKIKNIFKKMYRIGR